MENAVVANTGILSKADFKRIRLHLQMTQQEFADKLGYATNVTINYKENGTRNITPRDTLMLQTEIASLKIKLKKK